MNACRSSISSDRFPAPRPLAALLRTAVLPLCVTMQLALSGCQHPAIPAQVINASVPTGAAKPVIAAGSGQDQRDAGLSPVTLRLEEVTGTLKSIDRRGDRIIVRLDDGKLARMRLAGVSRQPVSAQPGQRIGLSLRESVEIVRGQYFHAVTGHIVAREAPGSAGERENYNTYYNRAPTGHHGAQWVEVMDIPAQVVETYPERAEIRLITRRGREFTVRVSDPRFGVRDLIPHEPVVVRFREVDEIHPLDQQHEK